MDFQDDQFEWDVDKSEGNRRKHGFDFFYARRAFEDADYVEALDDREDYGEERLVAIGKVDDGLITVVYTPRGKRRRIISGWYSDDGERDDYFRPYYRQ